MIGMNIFESEEDMKRTFPKGTKFIYLGGGAYKVQAEGLDIEVEGMENL